MENRLPRKLKTGEIVLYNPESTNEGVSMPILALIIIDHQIISSSTNLLLAVPIETERENSLLNEFAIHICDDDLVYGSIPQKSTVLIDKPVSIPEDELHRSSLGMAKIGKLQEILAVWLKLNTQNYYHSIHRPAINGEFIPQKTPVPYGGRIFDEHELINLIDASLEFYLTAGRYDDLFCKKLSTYFQSETAPKGNSITCNSGSSANLIAISSLTSPKLGELTLEENDEIITIAAGFPTTVAPIVQNRLVPVFVDIEMGTYNVDPNAVEKAVGPKTKAVCLPHTLGVPFDLDKILGIAEKYNLWVIEDNCDALGAEFKLSKEYNLIKNKRVSGVVKTGSCGHLGTCSFYPAHQITMGEGGAVFTTDSDLYHIAKSFRDWGRDCWCPSGKDNSCGKRFDWQFGLLPRGYDHKYTYSHLGYNLKITDMQASIGVAQLDKLNGFVKTRHENWKRLWNGLIDLQEYFVLPKIYENMVPSFFGFVLTVKENDKFCRDDLIKYLEMHKIQTRMVFAGNILRQPAFSEKHIRIKIGNSELLSSKGLSDVHLMQLPNTEMVMNSTFWIGVYPGMKPEMIDHIIETFYRFINKD